jgi:hypothetical protein
VSVVHDLDEGLDAGTTLDKLLHLRGRLAHGLGDWERGLGDTWRREKPGVSSVGLAEI